MFYDRCWFIIRNQEKNNTEILHRLADIYINKKYLGVAYDDVLEKQLNTCVGNFGSPLRPGQTG